LIAIGKNPKNFTCFLKVFLVRLQRIMPTDEILREWLAEFEAASKRPLEQRWRYAFIKTYKPVMDDARFRAFATMEDYRRWCEENLPRWLGYARV
jgi:hypothetical protein